MTNWEQEDVSGRSLPRGWAYTHLQELVGPDGYFGDGDWIESKDQDPSGHVRLIQLADIGDGCFKDKSSRFLTEETAERLKCTRLTTGDVLIARMPEPLGRACIFPGSVLPCITAVDICIVRTGIGQWTQKWLMYAINSPQFRVEVSARARGSTRKRISRSSLNEIPIPLPPLPEQRRIVERLDELLSRVDAAEAALRTVQVQLKRYWQAVLKAAFDGNHAELRRDGRAPTGEASWTTLGELGVVSGGITKNRQRQHHSLKLPYVSVAHVQTGHVDTSELPTIGVTPAELERAQLKKNDLLVVEGNGSRQQIGRAAIWPGLDTPCVHQNHIIKVRLGDLAVPSYVLFWLLSPDGRSRIEQVASSTSGLYTLSLSKVRSLPVPVVSREKQESTVSRLEQYLSIVDEASVTVNAAVQECLGLRRAILRRALAGRLVERDPADEPAERAVESTENQRQASRSRVPTTRPRRRKEPR